MSIAGFITIKMNSQRLPNKNILDLGGHPMCSYILNTLLSTDRLNSVSVFCSSDRIMRYVPDGVNLVLRDAALDADEVKGLDLFQAFARTIEADYYLLGHATAPFMTSRSVEAAISAVESGVYDSAFTAQRIQTYSWFGQSPINYNPVDMARTQDIQPILVESSGIYLFSRDLILNHRRRIGDRPFIVEVGHPECIDVDTLADFRLAEKFADQLPAPYDRSSPGRLAVHGGYR